MKTRLVDAKNQQQKPKNKKLIGRFFASLLSFTILGIGFMRAGWTNQKQALHDTISGTRYIEEVQYSGWRTALIIIGSILIDISAHLLSL